MSSPYLMKYAPSIAAVAAKAQHHPHFPWFLIALTAPFSLQSAESERFESSR